MNDKKLVYGSILITALLLTVGLTYAYFSLIASGNEEAEIINVETTKLELKYTDGKEIKANGIVPGWTMTKTITVENKSDEETYYALGWQKLYNEIQKEELVIRSTCTSSGVTGGTCSSTDNVVIPQTSEVNAETDKVLYSYTDNVLILSGETHTYTVTIEFINYTDKHQNYNQGKRFYGVLGAAKSTKIVTLANYLLENYSTLGLTKIDQTATGNQKYATTEYRYQGATPNNYIAFNGEENAWRIIGVFEVETPNDDGTYTKEYKVKIVRESLGNCYWNTVKSGTNYNDWTGSTINKLLNDGPYYNKTKGLTAQACSTGASGEDACDYTDIGIKEESKQLISKTKWYLGNVIWNNGLDNTKNIYAQERSTNVRDGNKQTWDGNVALMYPSDYMYASSSCYDGSIKGYDLNLSSPYSNDYRSDACKTSNWLYETEFAQWSLSPSSDYYSNAISISFNSHVDRSQVNAYKVGIKPTLYLNSDIKYVSGSGKENNPFVIE